LKKCTHGLEKHILPCLFLAIKELLQFILHFNLESCNRINNIATTLTWLHISFQPFFLLLFTSAFSKRPELYKMPLIICIVYALFNSVRLDELSVRPIKHKCPTDDPSNSWCGQDTCSIKGKHHLAYRYSLESSDYVNFLKWTPSYFTFLLLMFAIPYALGDWQITSINLIVSMTTFTLMSYDMGEAAATWCLNTFWIGFLSIYVVYNGNPFR